jgi:hypothetical protein
LPSRPRSLGPKWICCVEGITYVRAVTAHADELVKDPRDVMGWLDRQGGPCGGLTLTSYLSSRRQTVIIR